MTFSNCLRKTRHAARISNLIIENRFSASNTNGKDNNMITRERILMPGLFFTASIKKMPMYTKVRFEQS